MLNRNHPDYVFPATPEALFIAVADHLMVQGAPAAREGKSGPLECCYRAPNGRVCAAGALIPDRLYSPSMEGQGANSVLFDAGLLADKHEPRAHLALALQRLHDDAPVGPPEVVRRQWARALAQMATKHGWGLPPSVVPYLPLDPH